MAWVDAVFGHGLFVWLLQNDVAMMILDPGLDGTASVSDVDLTTLSGNSVHDRSLESQIMLHRPKEAGDLRRG
jgi:hypothetical protein